MLRVRELRYMTTADIAYHYCRPQWISVLTATVVASLLLLLLGEAAACLCCVSHSSHCVAAAAELPAARASTLTSYVRDIVGSCTTGTYLSLQMRVYILAKFSVKRVGSSVCRCVGCALCCCLGCALCRCGCWHVLTCTGCARRRRLTRCDS